MVSLAEPGPAVLACVQAIVEEWRADAARRREQTPGDAAANVLDYCARGLLAKVTAASSEDEEISAEEYGALHKKSGSQARRWCQAGLIPHRRAGRDYLIRRGTPPPAHVRPASAEVAA